MSEKVKIVTVGHSGESGIEEEVWVKEYQLKTMETTGPNPSPLYIKKPVIIQVPYLRRIFPNPYLSIKPST